MTSLEERKRKEGMLPMPQNFSGVWAGQGTIHQLISNVTPC